MAKNPKCKDCGEEIVNKEDAIKKSNGWFCISCQEKREKHNEDKNEFFDYVCNLYGVKMPSGMILKQMSDYVRDYGYTYKGMTLSLKYFYELQENVLKEDVGIGIIPFVYEQAKSHFININKVKKSIKNINEDKLQENIFYIKKDKENKKINNDINIDNL